MSISLAGLLGSFPDSLAETRPGEAGKGIDLLEKITSQSSDLNNVSVSHNEQNCTVLGIGQYATLSMPTRRAFGTRFVDEFSVLIHVRYALAEDTSLLTVLNHRNDILLQLRINPYALTFVTTRRRHYEFPVSVLADGTWHRVALAVSSESLELHVDCELVESVPWKDYFGMGISTEGLLLLGGIIEAFETPFEGSLSQLSFIMGDPAAAREHCNLPPRDCRGAFKSEAPQNTSTSLRDTQQVLYSAVLKCKPGCFGNRCFSRDGNTTPIA
ncbi:UNVERIFIED_CONTAM: hypothetical protein FKN15_007005 [Acipenser sinensis]